MNKKLYAILSMFATGGITPVMDPGSGAKHVKRGSPGVAKRRVQRKAQKIARRANRRRRK